MTKAEQRIHEFNRFGSVLGLERMTVLLEKLGDPHKDLQVIHVAGTNGKGSVCKYLETGLAACGYKVGMYTSPFIECFNDRIRFAGENISDEDLEIYTDRVITAAEEMVAEGKDSPTEFEVVTAVALLYYHEKAADIVILEVGLGGKGDSTNVIDKPLACAITSISYDHMDRLGDTLAEIAADKAGIIKAGVPVISNVSAAEAAEVIAEAAAAKEAELYDVAGISCSITDDRFGSQKVSAEILGTAYDNVEIGMIGAHQAENLKTALAVIEVLIKEGKINVERAEFIEELKKASLPGRFELVHEADPEKKETYFFLDGAHNEAGARALRETIAKYFPDGKIMMVIGMLADKEVDDILKHFTAVCENFIVTEPNNPRKLPAAELAAKIREMGMYPMKAFDAEAALHLAEVMGEDYDAVVIAGSLYLISEIREVMNRGNGEESK